MVVRLEASTGTERPGETRLLAPLSVSDQRADAEELPPVPRDLCHSAIQSIHDLHRELADNNLGSTWCYLPVAEWQPVMSVLPTALELGERLGALARQEPRRFVLAVPSPVVAGYLQNRFAADGGVAIVMDWKSRLRWTTRRAKAVILRAVNAIAWLAENAQYVRKLRKVRTVPVLPRRIDTLFISRIETGQSPRPDGVWRDTYLGSLPADGYARTGSVAILLRNGGDPLRHINSIAGFTKFPAALVFECLSLWDICECLLRAGRFRLKIGDTRSALGRAAAEESRGHLRALADWFVVEQAVRNFLRISVPRQIVCMQESSSWEFAIVRAASDVCPEARTFGFFHCPVMPSAHRYRTRPDILARRPSFGTTITLGSAMRNALLRLGDWESLLSIEHFAFRNPELEKCLALPIRMPSAHLRLLVVLGGMFDNARFLAWVKDATSSFENLTIVVKPHPSFKYQSVLAEAGVDVSDRRFALSPHREMDRALGNVDILVYKGTTACFASLAAGVPVIHVGDGGIATDDALFDAEDLSISVGDRASMVREITRLRSQTLEARQAWAARARAYVREYFDLSAESRDAVLDYLFPASLEAHTGTADPEVLEVHREGI